MSTRFNLYVHVCRLRKLSREWQCSAPDSFWQARPHELAQNYNGIGSLAIFPSGLRWLAAASVWLVTRILPTWEVPALIHDWEWRNGRKETSFHAFWQSNCRAVRNAFCAALGAYRIYHVAFYLLMIVTLLFFVLISTFGYFAWKK